jgi:hypothetical protein
MAAERAVLKPRVTRLVKRKAMSSRLRIEPLGLRRRRVIE